MASTSGNNLRTRILTVLRARFPRRGFVHSNEIAAFIPEFHPQTVKVAAFSLVQQRRLISRKGPGGGYQLR